MLFVFTDDGGLQTQDWILAEGGGGEAPRAPCMTPLSYDVKVSHDSH